MRRHRSLLLTFNSDFSISATCRGSRVGCDLADAGGARIRLRSGQALPYNFHTASSTLDVRRWAFDVCFISGGEKTPNAQRPMLNVEQENQRVRGIEPPCAAWEAAVLPLNYTREKKVDS
jgi:hypothetical protein